MHDGVVDLEQHGEGFSADLEWIVFPSFRADLGQYFQPHLSEFATELGQKERDLVVGSEQQELQSFGIDCDYFHVEDVFLSPIQPLIEEACEKDCPPWKGFKGVDDIPHIHDPIRFSSPIFLEMIAYTQLISDFLSWFITKYKGRTLSMDQLL